MEQLLSNRELAHTIFTAMNSRNFSEFENYLEEDTLFDFPGAGELEGRKEGREFFSFSKSSLENIPVWRLLHTA
jgi:hypothetical protein